MNDTIKGVIKNMARTMDVPLIAFFCFQFINSRKHKRFIVKTQSVPPDTPVYSYHCIQLVLIENVFPKVSHG